MSNNNVDCNLSCGGCDNNDGKFTVGAAAVATTNSVLDQVGRWMRGVLT